ncbi:MAG: hypothetical protein U9R47_04930, partial [Actinomycetota bacterium]|nr:hypothetical protein [Actinomycetota bacterium]
MDTSIWIVLVVAIAIIVVVALIVTRRSSESGPSSPRGVEAPDRGLRSKLSRTRSAMGDRLGVLLGS